MRHWGVDEWIPAVILGVCGLALVGLLGFLGVMLFQESTEIRSGTVVDKAYYPETVNLVPVYVSCGNGCTSMIVQTVVTLECYTLYLREGDETGDVCVDVRQFDQIKEGEFYGAPK